MRGFPGLFLGLAIAGCSSSRPMRGTEASEPQPKQERSAPLADYEATLNPSDFDQEVDIVRKTQAEDKALPPLEFPQDSAVVQEDILQGFRIQIMSSSSIDDATAGRTAALLQFPKDSVYIVYDPPVYKVRVGDFVSRYQADQRMPEFLEKGYKDAWIVPDRIVRRRVILVPQRSPGEGL